MVESATQMRMFACAIAGLCLLMPLNAVDRQPSLLDSARIAIGGQALQRVRTLQVDLAREGAGMDFRLPQDFRFRTGAGSVEHILQGLSFRQTETLPDDVRAEAHARTEFTFAVNAIKYLLAIPEVLDIRVVPSEARSVEGLGVVDVVAFEGKRGFKCHLFLDRSTHMPLGSEYLYPVEGGALELMSARYEDYREVDGIQFPFVAKGMMRGYAQTTRVTRIRVNADLTEVFGVK